MDGNSQIFSASHDQAPTFMRSKSLPLDLYPEDAKNSAHSLLTCISTDDAEAIDLGPDARVGESTPLVLGPYASSPSYTTPLEQGYQSPRRDVEAKFVDNKGFGFAQV
jgi:hypothetical protein